MSIRNLIQEMNKLAQEARNGDGYRRYNQRKLCEKFEKLSSELSELGDKLREAIESERLRADTRYYLDGMNGTLEAHSAAIVETDSLINQISNFDQ